MFSGIEILALGALGMLLWDKSKASAEENNQTEIIVQHDKTSTEFTPEHLKERQKG
jgi:hypothetical protein